MDPVNKQKFKWHVNRRKLGVLEFLNYMYLLMSSSCKLAISQSLEKAVQAEHMSDLMAKILSGYCLKIYCNSSLL